MCTPSWVETELMNVIANCGGLCRNAGMAGMRLRLPTPASATSSSASSTTSLCAVRTRGEEERYNLRACEYVKSMILLLLGLFAVHPLYFNAFYSLHLPSSGLFSGFLLLAYNRLKTGFTPIFVSRFYHFLNPLSKKYFQVRHIGP